MDVATFEQLAPFLTYVERLGAVGCAIFLILYLRELKKHDETRKEKDELQAEFREHLKTQSGEAVSALKENSGALGRLADLGQDTRSVVAKISEAITVMSAKGGRRG